MLVALINVSATEPMIARWVPDPECPLVSISHFYTPQEAARRRHLLDPNLSSKKAGFIQVFATPDNAIFTCINLAERVENKMKVSESIRSKQKTMLVRSLYADFDFLPDKTVFKPEIGFLVNRTRLLFFLKLPLSFCTSSIPKWAKSRNDGKP